MSWIVEILNMAKSVHSGIAGDVYPHGARLHCKECRYTEDVTTDQCARYFAEGWPRHCGQHMVVGKLWQCEHEGCESTDTIECRLQMYEEDEETVERYCAEHCREHGYCYLCGWFWAGIERFDFDPGGLCPECRSQVDADQRAEEEEAAEWGWMESDPYG